MHSGYRQAQRRKENEKERRTKKFFFLSFKNFFFFFPASLSVRLFVHLQSFLFARALLSSYERSLSLSLSLCSVLPQSSFWCYRKIALFSFTFVSLSFSAFLFVRKRGCLTFLSLLTFFLFLSFICRKNLDRERAERKERKRGERKQIRNRKARLFWSFLFPPLMQNHTPPPSFDQAGRL